MSKEISFLLFILLCLYATACDIRGSIASNGSDVKGISVSLSGDVSMKIKTTSIAQVEMEKYYFKDQNSLGNTGKRVIEYLNNELTIPDEIAGSDHHRNIFGFNIIGDPSVRPR